MSNQLRVKVVNDKVILPDSFYGLDTTNVLSSMPSNGSDKTYTATQDCIASSYSQSVGSAPFLTLDGVRLLDTDYNYGFGTMRVIPMKKGQTLWCSNNGGVSIIKVFGMKY